MLAQDAATRAIQAHLSDDLAALGRTHAACAAHGMAWHQGQLSADVALGFAQLDPAPRPLPARAVFDLASVTKALVTATLWMRAVDAGLAAPHTPLAALWPAWDEAVGDNGATFAHLLNHSSGLPAWHKFYEEYPIEGDVPTRAARRDAILSRIAAMPRLGAPGQVYAYSDLGYIALCHVLERLWGAPLDGLAQDQIFGPLGMTSARFVREAQGERILDAVATERCARRGGVVVGRVHDENSALMGGVSGHAGAFCDAPDLLRFGVHMLGIDQGQGPGIVSREILRWCWSEDARGADGHHLGGWDTPSGPRSSAGRHLTPEATVGHLGFTGTSLWIDRATQRVAVLLTNRVHPTRDNPHILAMRIAFHEAIAPAPSRA